MQSYTHFTLSERESLRVLLSQEQSIRKIAEALKRSPSSISRELRRNQNKATGVYNAWGATTLYLKRRKRCRQMMRFQTETALILFTQDHLRRYWSPEMIAWQWRREHAGDRLSHGTIYAALRKGLVPHCSRKEHLRRRGRRKYERGATATIKPERILKDRCAEANLRQRIGDWEGDTMYGSMGKGCLLTCVDRKSRYLAAAVLPNKSADTVRKAFRQVLRGHTVRTLTLDNGAEFSMFQAIEQDLGAEIYFCDPRAPWQRGTNENANGLLRFFFPKGTDFLSVTQQALDHVLAIINTRPRKCLGGLSSSDFLRALCCT